MSVGTPKAGVFAEGQAGVVADRVIALMRGEAVMRLLREITRRGAAAVVVTHDAQLAS